MVDYQPVSISSSAPVRFLLPFVIISLRPGNRRERALAGFPVSGFVFVSGLEDLMLAARFVSCCSLGLNCVIILSDAHLYSVHITAPIIVLCRNTIYLCG